MVDTVRPLAALQNLLADNSAGDISAQDLRDAIVSLWVSTIPEWSDIDHLKEQHVRRPDGNVYVANDPVPAGTGFVIGTTGATWTLVLDGSGKLTGITSGRLITVAPDGTPIESSLQEEADRIRTSKQIEAPGGGGVILSNWDAQAQGGTIGFNNLATNQMFLPVATELQAGGSQRPVYLNLAAVTEIFNQSDTSITIAVAQSVHQFSNVNVGEGSATRYDITRPNDALTAANCNLIIRLNSHADPIPLVDYKRDHPQGLGFDMVAGTNTINLPVPAFFPAGVVVYVEIVSDDGDNLNMLGANLDLGDGVQEIPAGAVYGRLGGPEGMALQSEVRTDAQILDLIAGMVTGGTNNGVIPTRNGNVIDFTAGGGVPQPGPAITAFSIDIPATVNVGTDLNVSHTTQFTTAQTAQIASMNLVVTTGTDQALTVPSIDGTHSQSVTLAGIDTSAAGTVTFQIRATTTGGQTIMSNSQTVTIRAQTADELAYYGVRPTNDFASVNLSSLTSADVQPPASQYTISGSWPNQQFVGILEPTDRPITSIVETAFNQETLSTWTRSAAARTINGQSYDLLTLQNNAGVDGTFEFRVTHG